MTKVDDFEKRLQRLDETRKIGFLHSCANAETRKRRPSGGASSREKTRRCVDWHANPSPMLESVHDRYLPFVRPCLRLKEKCVNDIHPCLRH